MTRYTVEKFTREETDGYGKAGEVEWHVVDAHTQEVHDVFPLKRIAKAVASRMNEVMA